MRKLGKVRRASVMVCLQCPLCSNLVVEATTISECLHTFCRNCIYEKLNDGETDCCPICNVNLGCLPIEKLRPDHQLDDVRMKLFPLRPCKKRRSVVSDVDTHVPMKRKERTLSSLGIGAAQPSGNPGYATRKTKAISRRSATTRDPNADGHTDSKPERDDSEMDTSPALSEEENVAATCVDDDLEGKRKDPSFAGGKRAVVSVKEESSCFISVRRTPLPHKLLSNDFPCDDPAEAFTNGADSLSMYLAERSTKISANGLLHPHFLCKLEQHRCQDDAPATFSKPVSDNWSERSEEFGDLSTLAHLAEVAIDHASELESPRKTSISHLTGSHPKRIRRKRSKMERPPPDLGKAFMFSSRDENLPLPLKHMPPSPLSLPERERMPAGGLDKLPIIRKKLITIKEPEGMLAPIVKDSRKVLEEAGFWFCLQASENQAEENALPQIAARYIRIKDGKLPVSFVKKYLVKKLDLKSESEVEITCNGQPLVPSLPLESIRGIWFSTFPPSLKPPPVKKPDGSVKNSRRLFPTGGSGKDYTMVLTYGRNRRLINSQ